MHDKLFPVSRLIQYSCHESLMCYAIHSLYTSSQSPLLFIYPNVIFFWCILTCFQISVRGNAKIGLPSLGLESRVSVFPRKSASLGDGLDFRKGSCTSLYTAELRYTYIYCKKISTNQHWRKLPRVNQWVTKIVHLLVCACNNIQKPLQFLFHRQTLVTKLFTLVWDVCPIWENLLQLNLVAVCYIH